jgi:hypothetical protein
MVALMSNDNQQDMDALLADLESRGPDLNQLLADLESRGPNLNELLAELEERRRDALVADVAKEFAIARQDQAAGEDDPRRVALELLAAGEGNAERWAKATEPERLRCLAREYLALVLEEGDR